MDAATQRQWEVWANAIVQAKLLAFTDIMGAEVAEIEKQWLTRFKVLDDKVATLEAELEILRLRNVTPLPLRGRDVA